MCFAGSGLLSLDRNLLWLSVRVYSVQNEGAAPQSVQVLEHLASALDVQAPPVGGVLVLQFESAVGAHVSDRHRRNAEAEFRRPDRLTKFIDVRVDDSDLAVWLRLVPEQVELPGQLLVEVVAD